jgi:hypothetical protein
MLKRIACLIALSVLALAQSNPPSSPPSSEALRGLMRVVLANVQKADNQLANYAYTRTSVRSDLNSDGSVKERHKDVVLEVTPSSARRREDTSWLKEFPEALEYKKIGEEEITGRVAWVLEYSTRAGYKAQSLRARVFEKTQGKVWVDVADSQLVRVDAAVFDTVSIGGDGGEDSEGDAVPDRPAEVGGRGVVAGVADDPIRGEGDDGEVAHG